jgi:hypothetical protein
VTTTGKAVPGPPEVEGWVDVRRALVYVLVEQASGEGGLLIVPGPVADSVLLRVRPSGAVEVVLPPPVTIPEM